MEMMRSPEKRCCGPSEEEIWDQCQGMVKYHSWPASGSPERE